MRVAPTDNELELGERHVTGQGEDPNCAPLLTDECDPSTTRHGDTGDNGDKRSILMRNRPKAVVKFPREKSAVDTCVGAATPATFVDSESDTDHVHYTRSINSLHQTPRFRRPNFGMTQIIPTLCLIGIVIAIVASLSILLPAHLGLKMSTVEDKPDTMLRSKKMSDHHVTVLCTNEPPSPGCLVWDWKQGNYELGTIINYWCATTTSYIVYVTVECVSNRSWIVTSFADELPCSCKLDWLQGPER
uniref:Uncharacterized protein n=1 Tax=Strigamia maritima TaxID=126957 RepID=T1J112_STRMM